jgi:hypothetical protein
MSKNFDEGIEALRSEPASPRYAEIDQGVWRGIAEARRARQAAPMLYAVRAAAVVGALGLGVAGGGATAVAVANEAPEVSAFSIHTELAPSTLLDHHR